jgi:hypothetical protein
MKTTILGLAVATIAGAAWAHSIPDSVYFHARPPLTEVRAASSEQADRDGVRREARPTRIVDPYSGVAGVKPAAPFYAPGHTPSGGPSRTTGPTPTRGFGPPFIVR